MMNLNGTLTFTFYETPEQRAARERFIAQLEEVDAPPPPPPPVPRAARRAAAQWKRERKIGRQ